MRSKLPCCNTLVVLLIMGWLPGIGFSASAQQHQHLTPAQEQVLERHEDSLKGYAYNIVNAETAADRFIDDSSFIRSLVRSLREPNSFYYPFDSLETISRLYAPDSSFRILDRKST